MIALDRARDAGVEDDENAWSLQRCWSRDLARTWQEPDHGLWEIRGEPQRFTHSRVMVWAAFDRAVAPSRSPRPRRAGRRVAADPRRGPRRGAGARLRRGAEHLHPALRHDRGRRLAAGAAADRLPRRRRPADARHDRGRRAGPDARRPAAALPHPVPASTASPATSTRSWPARSGWSRPTPPPAAPTTRTRCSTGWSAWPTTSACSRRSTTRRTTAGVGRMVGNFPQAFSHLALVQAAFRLAGTPTAESLPPDPDDQPLGDLLEGRVAGVGHGDDRTATLLELRQDQRRLCRPGGCGWRAACP